MEHPHLHCIMPAGGLSFDHGHWVHTRKKQLLYCREGSGCKIQRKVFHHDKTLCGAGYFKLPLPPPLVILRVELNPPSRVAISKVPDFFYTRKLITTKIFDYEKEIGFYYR